MKTYCDFCEKPRNDRGNDGYFSKDGKMFIHLYCIWALFEEDVWRKLKAYNRKNI